MLIRDSVHSGSCPFWIVSNRAIVRIPDRKIVCCVTTVLMKNCLITQFCNVFNPVFYNYIFGEQCFSIKLLLDFVDVNFLEAIRLNGTTELSCSATFCYKKAKWCHEAQRYSVILNSDSIHMQFRVQYCSAVLLCTGTVATY